MYIYVSFSTHAYMSYDRYHDIYLFRLTQAWRSLPSHTHIAGIDTTAVVEFVASSAPRHVRAALTAEFARKFREHFDTLAICGSPA